MLDTANMEMQNVPLFDSDIEKVDITLRICLLLTPYED